MMAGIPYLIEEGANVDWRITIITVGLPAILSTIVTLAGMYFKHQMDKQEYQKVNKRVDEVNHKLENGIKTTLIDTNKKVEELISISNKDGC